MLIHRFAAEEEFEKVVQCVENTPYFFGATSNNPRLPIWRGEVPAECADCAARALERHLPARFDVVSTHLNLQTQGLDGAFHIDGGADPHFASLIWYVHRPPWPREFGGFLLVETADGRLEALPPQPNSAVLIEDGQSHCALAPSRLAEARARISLALRLKRR